MAGITGPDIERDGLVLHLDAASSKSYYNPSDTWYDLSNRGHHGSLIGGVTYNDPISLNFDGIDGYVNITDHTDLQVDNFTLEAWVYPLNNTTNGHIIRKEASYILSHYWTSTTQKLGVWVQRSGSWESTHADIEVPLNTWCHVAGTYDNNNVLIYYNSDLVKTNPKSGSIRVTTNSVQINGTISNSEYQNYNLSQVRIYNRALSDEEIGRNYEITKGRFGL